MLISIGVLDYSNVTLYYMANFSHMVMVVKHIQASTKINFLTKPKELSIWVCYDTENSESIINFIILSLFSVL